MLTWTLHDVPADGSCFYCCITTALQTGGHPDVVREMVASELEENPTAQKVVAEACALVEQHPALRVDFPLIAATAVPRTYEALASTVRRRYTWASEVEVEIVKGRMATRDIALVVLQASSPGVLLDGTELEMKLHGLLPFVPQRRAVVLVHVEDIHYMWLSLGYRGVVETEELLDYVQHVLG